LFIHVIYKSKTIAMFENLLNLVKENAGDAIINNPAIPNERNDEAISTASSSIIDGLKNAVSSGNISGIMEMFTGGNAAATPLAQNIHGGFVQNLINQFGLNSNQAGGIANSLLPNILNKFVHKTNDPNDNSFDLQSILHNVGGGSLDVQNILSKFNGGATSSGLMDTVKGLFQ
jgi:hypothetical protein